MAPTQAIPNTGGDIFDYDQKMVETAALDLALCLAPDMLWTPLTDAQKQNVYRWLNQMNAHRIHPNNWRFFRILTNMTFARLGLPYDTDQLKDDFGVVEHCYTGGGWYFDGNPGQMDYYIPLPCTFTHSSGRRSPRWMPMATRPSSRPAAANLPGISSSGFPMTARKFRSVAA